MPNPDPMPDSTTIADQLEAKRHATYPHLVAAGMLPDKSLLDMIDLSSVKHVDGHVVIPPTFAADLKARKPHLFAEEAATFDARTASAADADRRFAEIQRGIQGQRAAAATARTMAELRAGR